MASMTVTKIRLKFLFNGTKNYLEHFRNVIPNLNLLWRLKCVGKRASHGINQLLYQLNEAHR